MSWLPQDKTFKNNMVMTKAEKVKQGKKNKAAGAKFEKKVREQYESEDWIFSKWNNNIEDGKIIPARNYYIPGRGNVMGSGFPDFIMFRKDDDFKHLYEVMFVEAKLNGFLSKEEKEKLKVLNDMGHKTYVAYEDKSQPNGIRLREYVHTKGKEKILRG